MCGIAGFYNLDGAPASSRALLRMVAAQRHRGPDDEGAVLFSLKSGAAEPLSAGHPEPTSALEGALGLSRLSILDLSSAGHQPMWNSEGTVCLAFNGEIYNAFDYRGELEAAGFRFRSRTDTEVVLYLYEKFGWLGMLERLEGMFAICLVDLVRKELRVARDPFGIKPLYWAEAGRTLLFASEAKAFLHHPAFVAELDTDRLDEYLTFRFCAAPRHLLRGVHQLEPGSFLQVRPEGMSLQRYWRLSPRTSDTSRSPSRSLDLLEEHLRRSVRMQLLSDVPVGCQLSGGVDSSLVTLFAAGDRGGDMDGYSIIMEDVELSEDRWITEVKGMTGIRSHRVMLDDDAFLDHLLVAARYLDEPVAHPNSVGILAMAERASREVKVLLSGEGADEVFGGYTRFLYARIRPFFRPLVPALDLLSGPGRVLATKFGPWVTDPVDWFLSQTATDRDFVRIVRPGGDPRTALAERRALFETGEGGFLDRCVRYEVATYLVNLLLRQDAMTMAHSVENRVPFLDRALVGFARGLPQGLLVSRVPRLRTMRMKNTKVLLKRLASRHFGGEFAYRPKRGFALPLQRYFAAPRFHQMMQDRVLPGVGRRGLMSADVLERLWLRAAREPLAANLRESVWTCIALELWAQEVLDGTASERAEGGAPWRSAR